jgi:hypothetical protein
MNKPLSLIQLEDKKFSKFLVFGVFLLAGIDGSQIIHFIIKFCRADEGIKSIFLIKNSILITNTIVRFYCNLVLYSWF